MRGSFNFRNLKKIIFPTKMTHILCPTKVDSENDSDLSSACSNTTSVILVIVLGIMIGKGA